MLPPRAGRQATWRPRCCLAAGPPSGRISTLLEPCPTFAGRLPERAAPASTVLPRDWSQVIRKCLAPAPEDRFRSIAQVITALTSRRALVRWFLAAAAVVIVVLSAALWVGRETAPEVVRLAVLPFHVEGPAIPAVAGISNDLADRLAGARRNFSVLSPAEAARDQVDTPEKARTVLAATHVLSTRLRPSGNSFAAKAAIVDAATGQTLRELTGDYPANDAALLAKALIATVSRAFNLRAAAVRETVSPAAYPWFVQGMALVRRDDGSSDQAIPFLRKAIELDSRSALPLAGLAEAQLQNFDAGRGEAWLDGAAGSVAKARSINPDVLPVLLASGVVAQRRGRYEQALADYMRATQLEPNNAEGWRRLALGYQNSNRIAEAVATYRKAIELQPSDYRHYDNLAFLYFQRSDYARAEELDRHVVRIAPGFAPGHMRLALALIAQDKFAERTVTSDFTSASPDGAGFDEPRQSLLSTGAVRRSAPLLSRRGRIRHSDGLAFPHLGDAFRHLSHAAEARDAYARARDLAEQDVARNPRQASPRILLALMLARLGEARRALSEVAQSLALDPENATVMRNAVLTYEVLRERGKALEVLTNAPRDLVLELNRLPDVRELQQDQRFRSMMLRTSN